MPNRIIRNWTDSIPIDGLSYQAEVLFVRLIMNADDFGRYHADPCMLRASLFPRRLEKVREADISRWIAECEKAGLLVLYEADGKMCLEIRKFGQTPRAVRSRFPGPSDACVQVARDPPADCAQPAPECVDECVDECAISLDRVVSLWNELPAGIRKVRHETTKAIENGWRRVQRESELRSCFDDIQALFAAIRKAEFCHDKGWFTLDWLFSKGAGGEWNARKILQGRYESNGATKPKAPTKSDDELAEIIRNLAAPLNWGKYSLQKRFAEVGFDGMTPDEQRGLIESYRTAQYR